jgi:hypothetical protein
VERLPIKAELTAYGLCLLSAPLMPGQISVHLLLLTNDSEISMVFDYIPFAMPKPVARRMGISARILDIPASLSRSASK